MKIWCHLAVILCGLALFLALPALFWVDVAALRGDSVDATSHATSSLPAAPSGEYWVLLNENGGLTEIPRWALFFGGGDGGVIMSDVHCLVCNNDSGGEQLARRYQGRLAENQLTLRREDPLLVAAKVKEHRFEVVICGKELAEALALDSEDDGIRVVTVKGE